MSVWESTTYKLDIARAVYEKVPNLASKILGDTVGDYLSPRGSIVPVESEDTWDTLADECNWDIPNDLIENSEELEIMVKDVHSWNIGISAVYKLIKSGFTKEFRVRKQYDYALIDKRLKALSSIVGGSTLVHIVPIEDGWNRADEDLVSISRTVEDFSEAWKYLLRSIRVRDNEVYVPFDQEKYFGHGDRNYYGGSIGNLVIMVGSGGLKNRGLVMLKTHISILVEATSRISLLIDHIAREHAKDELLKGRAMSMLRMTINDGDKSKGRNADKVVQAYHKARAYMQMKMFSNVMENAHTEALLEFQKKNLQTVMDLGAYIRLFQGVPRGRWLELLHIYKWMPPPDFDSTYAFTELYEHHMAPRMSGIDPGATDEMKRLWSIVVFERKLNIAVAYHTMTQEWPHGLATEGDYPTEEGLATWEPKGLFPYFSYGKDITAQIKDKSTVLARITEEIKDNKHNPERNFLLWFLTNYGKVDTVTAAQDMVYGISSEDNYVRVAYKGEAHKPGSRLFFMAPPINRILLGELEGNISRIASHYPASMQGMDALKRSAKLNDLFNVRDLDFGIPSGVDFTCYIVTFDLSKFSPRFNPAVLKNLHDFWADVFSYEPIRAMAVIGADSTILHTTGKLIMQYKNKGADLEGFRGRMMTLFHADLIAAACREASRRGFIVGKVTTAVFIDDGALRIAAKGSGDAAKQNALEFLKVMQEVYESAGQENHPNKTIVSSSGGELLAEQYLYGQRLKCPVKAAMRLYPSYESPASCITEEFDALFASAQGVVKDGGDWVVAYRRLAECFVKTIYRWARKDFHRLDNIQFAIKVALPKSLGGFGFPTLYSLSGTTAYDMTSEGLGMLNYAGRMFEDYARPIQDILDRPVIKRAPVQILRDPGRVRMTGPVIVEGRTTSAILDYLEHREGPWAEFLGNYRNATIIEHATKVGEAIIAGDSVSFPVTKRVWECTPLAFLEGLVQKFRRAGSITSLIPGKVIENIRRKNSNDVHTIVRSFVPY